MASNLKILWGTFNTETKDTNIWFTEDKIETNAEAF